MPEPAVFEEDELFSPFPTGGDPAQVTPVAMPKISGIVHRLGPVTFTFNYDRLTGEALRRGHAGPADRSERIAEALSRTGSEQLKVLSGAGISYRQPTVSVTPSRIDRIVATLLQAETLSLLHNLARAPQAGEVHSTLMHFLLASSENLQVFATLVSEDLIGLEGSKLRLTEFGERIIGRLAGGSGAD